MSRTVVLTVWVQEESWEATKDTIDRLEGVIESEFVDSYED